MLAKAFRSLAETARISKRGLRSSAALSLMAARNSNINNNATPRICIPQVTPFKQRSYATEIEEFDEEFDEEYDEEYDEEIKEEDIKDKEEIEEQPLEKMAFFQHHKNVLESFLKGQEQSARLDPGEQWKEFQETISLMFGKGTKPFAEKAFKTGGTEGAPVELTPEQQKAVEALKARLQETTELLEKIHQDDIDIEAEFEKFMKKRTEEFELYLREREARAEAAGIPEWELPEEIDVYSSPPGEKLPKPPKPMDKETYHEFRMDLFRRMNTPLIFNPAYEYVTEVEDDEIDIEEFHNLVEEPDWIQFLLHFELDELIDAMEKIIYNYAANPDLTDPVALVGPPYPEEWFHDEEMLEALALWDWAYAKVDPDLVKLANLAKKYRRDFIPRETAEAIYKLYKKEPDFWVPERLARGFAVPIGYAKAAILLHEIQEYRARGEQFPYEKIQQWFKPERERDLRENSLQPRHITQEQAYQNYVRMMSIPGEYNETKALEGFKPKDLGPELTLKPEEEKTVPVPDTVDYPGINSAKKLTRSKFLFSEVGKKVTRESRKIIVREKDGTLRTANSQERAFVDRVPGPGRKKYL